MSVKEVESVCDATEKLNDELFLINKYLSDYQEHQERERKELIKIILQQLQTRTVSTAGESGADTSTGELFTDTVIHTSIHTSAPPVAIVSGIDYNSGATMSGASRAWIFTQGLIIGQVSVILLICAFIKFFVFTEASPIQAPPIKVNPDGVVKSNKKKIEDSRRAGGVITNDNSNDEHNGEAYNEVINQILEKTYYDVNKHQAESLDWFNVLIAQIISQGRFEALVNDNIYHSLNEALNQPQLLQFCDRLNITEVNIGHDYPIFSNCRVKNNEGRLEAKIDVDVADTFTIGIETNLLINQPRLMSACLPVKLSVSLVRFSSCLTVSLIATEKDEEDSNLMGEDNHLNEKKRRASTIHQQEESGEEGEDDEEGGQKKRGPGHSIGLMFAFSPDFRLEFEVKSLIGSKAKLENIPRISSLIENVLRKWFIDRCIEPRFQLIKLPSLWPRKKNTRVNVEESI